VSLESYEAEGVITNGQLQPVSVVVFRQAMREFADGRVVIRIETEEVAAPRKRLPRDDRALG
jgi:hypothetical protein